MTFKVEIADSQAYTFHQPQSASVEDFCHNAGRPSHGMDDRHGFFMSEDRGQKQAEMGDEDV
jgi:hypothetical protein